MQRVFASDEQGTRYKPTDKEGEKESKKIVGTYLKARAVSWYGNITSFVLLRQRKEMLISRQRKNPRPTVWEVASDEMFPYLSLSHLQVHRKKFVSDHHHPVLMSKSSSRWFARLTKSTLNPLSKKRWQATMTTDVEKTSRYKNNSIKV